MLAFRLFGRFEIELDGAPIDVPPGRRARSLLAWLALHPGPHPRSRLAARFWPDVLDSSARASLRVALSQIRSALGRAAEHLRTDRQQAGISTDSLWVDALAFHELVREGEFSPAIELARGELLPDLDDDWVIEARDAHAADVLEALGRLAGERELAGDLEKAIELTRRMVALDGLAEGPAQDLMRRLIAAGERSAAVAVFRRLSERLRRELGLAPAAETRALAAALSDEEVEQAEGDLPLAPPDSALAISHYEQALTRSKAGTGEDAHRVELLLGLGRARARAGDRAGAKLAFGDATEAARGLGDGQLLARAAVGAAGLGVTILDLDEALITRLEEAHAALPAGSPLHAEVLARLAIARAYDPDREASAALAEQAIEAARSDGGGATLARALCARHVALGGPDHLERRFATAAEMLEAAERAADREAALQARNWRVVDVLESGDMEGFERELEAYAAACQAYPLPAYSWYVPLWRATRATIAGALEEAERLAGEAREAGGRAGDENAEHFWRIQVGTLLLMRGLFAAIDTAWVEDHARRSPAGTAWWTVLAWIWAEQGRSRDAQTVVDRLAATDFKAIARDVNWYSAIAELVEACVRLGDRERAARLHELLLPFAGRIVISSRGAQAYGPVDYFLGLTAITRGNHSQARHHLGSALAMSQACGAHLWAERVRARSESGLLA